MGGCLDRLGPGRSCRRRHPVALAPQAEKRLPIPTLSAPRRSGSRVCASLVVFVGVCRLVGAEVLGDSLAVVGRSKVMAPPSCSAAGPPPRVGALLASGGGRARGR